jgi:folate-dependent phosphoribosylglycinamide formyltransferase PurN
MNIAVPALHNGTTLQAVLDACAGVSGLVGDTPKSVALRVQPTEREFIVNVRGRIAAGTVDLTSIQ